MPRRRLLLLLLLLPAAAIAGIVIALRAGDSTQADGDWAEPTAAPTLVFSGLSVAAARANAQDQERLLILDFTAEWCGPCKQMEATTWRDPRVIEWVNGNAIAVQVDVDRLVEVARAMDIHAMPTLIVERDGKELDRSTGMQSTGELIGWLERVQGGVESVPGAALKSRIRYTDVPDKGSANALLRYMTVQGMLARGEVDEALPEVEWLWAHGEEQQQSFGAVRVSFLSGSMKSMVEKSQAAEESFRRFLDTAQRAIDADQVQRENWQDWLELCEVVGEESRLIDWYQRARESDGSLDSGRYANCEWIAQSIFERLVELKRYEEAGRVYRTPTVPIDRQVAFLRMLREPPVEGVQGMALETLGAVTGARSGQAQQLRELAASLSATLIAAGRETEAMEVAGLLIDELNDGASRKTLISKAVEWSHPLPQHVRWYAEAVEHGEEIADLEPALEAAMRR